MPTQCCQLNQFYQNCHLEITKMFKLKLLLMCKSNINGNFQVLILVHKTEETFQNCQKLKFAQFWDYKIQILVIFSLQKFQALNFARIWLYKMQILVIFSLPTSSNFFNFKLIHYSFFHFLFFFFFQNLYFQKLATLLFNPEIG